VGKKSKPKERNELAYALAVRTGGVGKHKDRRTKRIRTRLEAKRRAIKDYTEEPNGSFSSLCYT
jgi:hypothetical protein